MSVIFGSARIDENGKAKGGKAGDQTGREISTQEYYNSSKGWYCLRAYDKSIAEKIALAMIEACENNNIGYDQNQRTTLITQLKALGKISRITTPCECDCSSLVRACVLQASGKDVGNFNTANERSVLLLSRMFYEVPFNFKSELCRGDILVTKTKGHTGVIVRGTERELEGAIGRVTAHTLNIRDGASTQCNIVGWYHRGATVVILESRNGWGRTDKGWISLKYVEYK